MRNSTGGGYNQTALGWQIGVLDRETGRIFTKTNAVGSGMRPELSPDGKWLAYATRNDADDVARCCRISRSGDEHMLLAEDPARRSGVAPEPRRVPDVRVHARQSKSIVIGHHGHFWQRRRRRRARRR